MYAGQRNRKRALPPKPDSSPLGEATLTEGRKSEPEAMLAVPVGLEAVTPPPQRRKSMAGTSGIHVPSHAKCSPMVFCLILVIPLVVQYA